MSEHSGRKIQETRRRQRPSPSMIVAVAALVMAMAGSALAVEGTARLSKKTVKSIATKQIDKKAPSLAVASAQSAQSAQNAASAEVAKKADSATTAGTATTAESATTAQDSAKLGGKSLNQVLPRSLFVENTNGITDLAGFPGEVVVSGNINPPVSSLITVNGGVELSGDTGDERVNCEVSIDGDTDGSYETTFDDVGVDNEVTLAIGGSQVAQGLTPVAIDCDATGVVDVDEAFINVLAVPVP